MERSRIEYQSFLRLNPQYGATTSIDSIRRAEYPHLDDDYGQVSFDYGGIGMFSGHLINSSQLNFSLAYTSSCLATHALYEDEASLEGLIRKRILSHFKLDQKDYCVVFAADALSAVRLLVESYVFKHLLLGYDFENESLSRIRLSAHEAGTKVRDVTLCKTGFAMHTESLRKKLQSGNKKKKHRLFAYPLISRVTGTENSVKWIREAQANGWSVLVDVSAAGATGFLDLASLAPDFIVGSFYKVFGMDPTGFGCLVIKKQMLSRLPSNAREVRAAGLVKLVPQPKNTATMSSTYYSGVSSEFKENNSPCNVIGSLTSQETEVNKLRCFQTLLSLLRSPKSQAVARFSGLDYAEKLSRQFLLRQNALLSWLRASLAALRHHPYLDQSNLVQIHSPPDAAGPVIAFSLFDFHGESLEPRLVQRLANRRNISLGTGVIQAPSTAVEYNNNVKCGLQSRQRKKVEERGGIEKLRSEQLLPVLCVTVGFLSNFSDAFRMLEFVEQFLDSDFCSREVLRYRGLNQETVIL